MSLDESGMAGVMSANKPIDAEFCKRVGMKQWGNGWKLKCFEAHKPRIESEVEVNGAEVFVSDEIGESVWLSTVNTQGRFLHLLRALGIEVPE